MKKVLFSFAIILFLSPALTGADYGQSSALNYLNSHADNPWSTLALSALGQPNIPSDYLKNISSDNAIDYTAPILAITALGFDPTNFGNDDYIAKLKSFYSQNQLGDPTLINDDIFSNLALISAGLSPSDNVVSDSKISILLHQNSDGGWGYSSTASSDSNTTAAAIVSLIAAGLPSSDARLQNAFNYLKTAQNSDGGFTYDPKSNYGTQSDTSSTAWAVWALNAAGIPPVSWSQDNHSPLGYVSSNQTASGYFSYQSGTPEDSFSPVTTAYAVIALSGKTLPLNVISKNQSAQNFPFRIEGSNKTICEGQTAGPTALDIIKKAADICGFTYNITQTAYGPYLDKINDDTASGMVGWLYLVNYLSPPVGAADYVMQTGDQVLWYFGEFGWPAARLALDQTEIPEGEQALATVEYYDGNNWLKLPDANVYAGTDTFQTNSNGTATFNPKIGYYQIYAEKNGYVRSNSKLLKTGSPSSSAVNLSVNAVSGEVNGTTTPSSIAFTVEPDLLNFGDLIPGQTSSRQLNFSNIGTENIRISGQVSGDKIFTDTLRLDSWFWKNFTLDLSAAHSRSIQTKISWPAGYQGGSGQKTGRIIFWATVNN